jgi:hypothetical protein
MYFRIPFTSFVVAVYSSTVPTPPLAPPDAVMEIKALKTCKVEQISADGMSLLRNANPIHMMVGDTLYVGKEQAELL